MPGMFRAIVDLDYSLVWESGLEIVDGAGSITPAIRATEVRRIPIESTGTVATAGRSALNSGEDEGGRETGGDRAASGQGRRGRPARSFATTRRTRARYRRRRRRETPLHHRAMRRGFPCSHRRGRRLPLPVGSLPR